MVARRKMKRKPREACPTLPLKDRASHCFKSSRTLFIYLVLIICFQFSHFFA